MTLAQLRVGRRAVILRLGGEGPLHQRLLDLGLTPGTTVEAVRSAPFGDPVQIRLRRYMLTLRRWEANAVELSEIL